MAILVIPNLYIFLGKIVRKNLKWPFFVIPNLYQSFWEKMLEKFRMAIFGHSKFIPVFLGKIVRNNLEWPFLAVLNLYQSFWGKLLEKFRMAIFGHSKFIPVFLGKIEKNWNGHFWPLQVFFDNFSVHITLIECNGLEGKEICTFLEFYSEI